MAFASRSDAHAAAVARASLWGRLRRLASPLARIPAIFYAYQWFLSRRYPKDPTHDAAGLAVPDRFLRMLVVGHGDGKAFLKSGADTVAALAPLFARAGAPLSDMTRVLDFGCGCGRLARHLPAYTDAEIHGVDINPQLVRWCQAHLNGVFRVNSLRPPLPAADGVYDGVVGLSVITHLRAETQLAWGAELARVTRPGGVVVLTFHDDRHPFCTPRILEALARDGFVTPRQAGEGGNGLASFQTHAWARDAFSRWFEVVELIDSAELPFMQAAAVLRRPG